MSRRPYRIRWHGAGVAGRIEAAANVGVLNLARAILRDSRPRVPIDTGAMRNSGRVYQAGRGQVVVGYRRPGPNGDVITVRQHEDLTLRHPRGGEAKWLERTFDEYRGRAALNEVLGPIRTVLGGRGRR